MEYLGDLRAFLKVVEKRNFSGAAKVLRISQSAVSKRISRLEAEIGVPLLVRSTHSLSLTDAGTRFYVHAERIVAEIDEAQRSALAMHAAVGGHIRVHSTLGIGQTIIAPVIASFLRRHKDVSVELVLSPNDSINLIQGDVDCAIRLSSDREPLVQHASIDHEVIGRAGYLVCAAPAYFGVAGRPETPADLTNHNCLILSAQHSSNAWEFVGPKGRYRVRVSGSFISNSGAALYQAVIQGNGIARMLEPAVRPELNDGRLVRIFADVNQPERLIVAYFPRVTVMPMRVRMFLDFLKDHMVHDGSTVLRETASQE